MNSTARTPPPPVPPLIGARRFIIWNLVVCSGFSLGFNLLMLTIPLYMMQVFDRVMSTRNVETLVVLTGIALVAISAMAFLDDARTRLLARVGRGLETRLGPAILEGSLAGSGPSTAQGLRDLSAVRSFFGGSAVHPFMDAPWSPVFLLVIYAIHPVLGHLALVGAIALFALALVNNRLTHPLTVVGNRTAGQVSAEVEQSFRNIDTIRAMGLGPALIERWRQGAGQAGDALLRGADRSSMATAASKFLRLGLQIGVMGSGAYLAMRGEISPGAMLAASIVLGRALAPVEQAIGGWRSFVGARHAWHATAALLETAGSERWAMKLPAPAGVLTVQDVTHVPGAGLQPVLQRVGFALAPGQAIGVAGPTGAGKSTLARIIAGAVRPTAGEVRLDGIEIAGWASAQRGPFVGYLPQEVELFQASVRDNIARMDVPDDEKVVAAARAAGVHEMILALPDGYDTEVGPAGTDAIRLSGGQSQRVGLARALYGDPVLIVLDEPSSNLDLEGEAALTRAITAAKHRGAVVVLIEHRSRLFDCVERVLVLSEGRMRDLGPTTDVIAKLARPAVAPTRNGDTGGR